VLAANSGVCYPRVLVVEDEALIGLLLKDMLEDLGYAIVGPIARYDEALAAARESEFELAILDVNLGGKSGTSIADILAKRGIPFAFATGYGHQLAKQYSHVPNLQKPFEQDELRRALSGLLGSRR
jgi:CheY-like chemotaxis protein